MALSGKERLKRYRERLSNQPHRKLGTAISAEAGNIMDTLAWHWGCSKKEAIERALKVAWEGENKPKKPERD